MISPFFAHGNEVHSNGADSIVHYVSTSVGLAIIITIGVIAIMAIIIKMMSKETKQPESKVKEPTEENTNE